MGLFGDDARQDERLDALELHVRAVTEAALQNQLDVAECRIGMMAIQAEIEAAVEAIQEQLEGKVSTGEIDPAINELNQELGMARERLEESSQAAVDTWATLQDGLFESFETLRESVSKAAESAKRI